MLRAALRIVYRNAGVLLFNDACERATGFSREEVVGRKLSEVLIPPEESEAFRPCPFLRSGTQQLGPRADYGAVPRGISRVEDDETRILDPAIGVTETAAVLRTQHPARRMAGEGQ